jgi:hypothetical protein
MNRASAQLLMVIDLRSYFIGAGVPDFAIHGGCGHANNTIRLREFRGLQAAVPRRWQGPVGTYFANLADLNARIKEAVRDPYAPVRRRAAVADGIGVGRMGKGAIIRRRVPCIDTA